MPQNKDQRVKGLNVCPKCDGERVREVSESIDFDYVKQRMHCFDCKAKWMAVFKFNHWKQVSD